MSAASQKRHPSVLIFVRGVEPDQKIMADAPLLSDFYF
jgi:hypothetical protein